MRSRGIMLGGVQCLAQLRTDVAQGLRLGFRVGAAISLGTATCRALSSIWLGTRWLTFLEAACRVESTGFAMALLDQITSHYVRAYYIGACDVCHVVLDVVQV